MLAKDNGLILPEKVDLFFLRNVFHHLPEPVEYFKNIRRFLNNEGKVTLIDYNKKGFSFVGIFGRHFQRSYDRYYGLRLDLICIKNLIFYRINPRFYLN